jgi:alpha-L-arabinofuranosidase
VGGWGDTRTALQATVNGEQREIGPSSNVTVETGRWYDITIDVRGDTIRCFLDNQLVTEAADVLPPPPIPVYATASRELKTGDVILKVVNVGGTVQPLEIRLQGAGSVQPSGVETVLSGQPGDSNSLADRKHVFPTTTALTGVGGSFDQSFPAYSVTVMRLHASQ